MLQLGKFITMDGVHCLDMATHNYLGLSGNSKIERAAADIIGKYGVGSCGPRAFYGTTDVHITLEERLANFLGMEQAVSYSYAFSTVASAIPAYAKKGDIIYADKLVSYAIQVLLQILQIKGIVVCTCHILSFIYRELFSPPRAGLCFLTTTMPIT